MIKVCPIKSHKRSFSWRAGGISVLAHVAVIVCMAYYLKSDGHSVGASKGGGMRVEIIMEAPNLECQKIVQEAEALKVPAVKKVLYSPKNISQTSQEVAGDDTPLEAIELPGNRRPVYPRLARLRRQEGPVDTVMDVSPDGHVDAIHITRSSGYELLDQAAIEAQRQWRFQAIRQKKMRQVKQTCRFTLAEY